MMSLLHRSTSVLRRWSDSCDSAVGRVLLALLILAGGGSASFGQSGETCATAQVIAPGAYSGDTTGSTNDGAASCGLAAASPDRWYSITPAQSCLLRVDTCGSSFDTVLSVHSGCPGSVANELACNDDLCSLGSSVVVAASANTSYYIRVAGYNSAVGAYALAVTCEVPSDRDRCIDAVTIMPGSYQGTTVGAANDGSASCGTSVSSPDTWYSITPPEACVLHVETCGSSFDTVASIHTACPGTPLNQLVCNDDACGLSSIIEIPGRQGVAYLIRISGFNGATGLFNMTVECRPLNQADECGAAPEIAVGETAGDTSSATPDGASGCGAASPDVWFRYTASDTCVLHVDTCDTSFDSAISVHSGCPGTTDNELACDDDSCGIGASVSLAVESGHTYSIRVAGGSAATGTFRLRLTCNPPGTDGADAYVGDIAVLQQFGRLGDTVGCVTDTPLCNAGTQPLPTMGHPNNLHPFFVWNMYRQSGGRFEQIGWSWAKHMCCAAQGNACGFGCTPFPNSTHLGAGCSDTYSAGYNATQSILGPRSEINPWTGAYSYAGSWIQRTGGAFDSPIDHRMQVRDADLDPAQNAGAVYLIEQYTVAPMDSNHMNSVAREPVSVAGAPGGTWTFGTGAVSTNGPAIYSWTGAQFSTIPPSDSLTDDGRCIAGYRVTSTGNGTWHYEYALYNHDMQRGVQAFSIPVGAASISGIGFHAPNIHGEAGTTNDPWTASVVNGSLVFQTTPQTMPVPANPLRWGTMYTFRFDADRPPVDSRVALTPYLPGAASPFFDGAALAPAGSCAADFDHNGTVTSEDFFQFLAAFFSNNADFNQDGFTNSQDFFDFISAFFLGC